MEAASALALRPGRLRELRWFHPEWPWLLLVAWAWMALVVAHSGVLGDSIHSSSAGASAGEPLELSAAGLASWSVMVVAMMVPATAPMLRRVSLSSLWIRRYRAAALALGAYLGIWLAFGLAVAVIWSPLRSGFVGSTEDAAVLTAVLLVVAAGWELSRWHRRFIKLGHRELPLAPRGAAADRSCLGFGAYHARQCLGSCWPVMLAMVPGHGVGLMLAATALVTWERLARVPPTRGTAGALLALAGVVAIVGAF